MITSPKKFLSQFDEVLRELIESILSRHFNNKLLEIELNCNATRYY